MLIHCISQSTIACGRAFKPNCQTHWCRSPTVEPVRFSIANVAIASLSLEVVREVKNLLYSILPKYSILPIYFSLVGEEKSYSHGLGYEYYWSCHCLSVHKIAICFVSFSIYTEAIVTKWRANQKKKSMLLDCKCLFIL